MAGAPPSLLRRPPPPPSPLARRQSSGSVRGARSSVRDDLGNPLLTQPPHRPTRTVPPSHPHF
eukprot:9092015-Pyramimonas_sp.AAC.1